MKKALIAYFSQGGTTRAVSEQILKGITDKFQVDLYDISDSRPPDINEYDMIGIGSPVYIFRPPFNVMQYIKNLPELDGLPFFTFILYGTKPGTAGDLLRNALFLKGGKEIGYAKFKGADFFLGYLQRGFLFSPDNPNKDELENAHTFGKKIANNFFNNNYIKPGRDSGPGTVYAIENLITKKVLVKYVYSYFFKADMEKCNSCKICIKKCPNNNIRLDKNDTPQWGRNCLFCFYCEMKCPKDAIKSPVDWPVMAPFMAYNVYQANKDPLIDQTKVIHSKGKTKRI
ncbi:MAG: EFR1 family ferrodoxin [Proteobacteria bacterium]|nr:EFR1 family ferrodoxin [Pseudomonadota bacterium]